MSMFRVQATIGGEEVFLGEYSVEKGAELIFDVFSTYMDKHPGLGMAATLLRQDSPDGEWATQLHREVNWPEDPPIAAETAETAEAAETPEPLILDGRSARELADMILAEYGSYGVSEWGEAVVEDGLHKLTETYWQLSDEAREVVNKLVAAELFGY